MASYKVAQDVEADDKLLGPFGFRQFIYLIIVAMAGILGYGLWQVFPPLAILPLPIIVLFGALALPLRKDQPMETYLAAMVSYYLKPRRRLWQPDGIENIIEITAPKTSEDVLTKTVGGTEADRRLGYLADIADSRGWSIRHATMPNAGTSMVGDVYNEAQATADILDETGGLAQNINSLIDKADATRRQQLINSMHSPAAMAQPGIPTTVAPQTMSPTPFAQSSPIRQPEPMAASSTPDAGSLQYNPYPSIHQSVIQPIGQQPQPAPSVQSTTVPAPAPHADPVAASVPEPEPTKQPEPETTSDNDLSPDIMNLANNSKNLSVETIAHEAQRLRDKKLDEGEVVIQLH